MALSNEREIATNAHDINVQQQRKPEPVISFHTALLSAENTKGVKNITRKIVKRLEKLGYLEMDLVVSGEEEDPEEWGSSGTVGKDVEDRQVEKVLYTLGRRRETHVRNGITNKKSTKLKPNLEIPRKVLHSSIGFLTLYLYISQGDVRTIILVLWMALAIIVPADILRFKSPKFEHLYERFLGFLMRESEKDSINGVVWYIIGINFALSFYPQDVATVAILILSWADTAASTIGRLFGSSTSKLPSMVPFLRFPLAPRKSLAGFLAASITGASIAFCFWGWIAEMRNSGRDVVWSWDGGVRSLAHAATGDGPTVALGAGGPLGLLVIAVVAGVVSGVAEALDLGPIDDNLSLPIISGCCILGFIKVLGLAAAAISWFS